MSQGERGRLLRVLGVAFGLATVVGGVIGQGILRAPGLVAQGAPDARLILLLWVAGGVLAAIDAMSTVELVASIRRTGGPYSFTTRAFGRLPGLVIGAADWLGYAGAGAFISVVFGEYLHRLGIATEVPVGVLAPLAVAVLAGIQLLGTRIGGGSQELGSAVKAIIFAGLIGVLLFAPHGRPAPGPAPAPALTLLGLIVAVRGVIGAYQGWNAAAYFGEEVKDAGHAIARATFAGIGLVTLVYVLVNVALLNVLTPREMGGSTLVAADAAVRVLGPVADKLVTAVALVSLVTILNVLIMTIPRILYAIARDADVPMLSRVASNGAPQAAVVLTALAEAALASVGVYALLLAFGVFLNTAVAAAVNTAAITLRGREPGLERPWRMPLFPLPAVFSLLVNLVLAGAFLYESPTIVLEATALAAVLGAGVWFATRGRIGPTIGEPGG